MHISSVWGRSIISLYTEKKKHVFKLLQGLMSILTVNYKVQFEVVSNSKSPHCSLNSFEERAVQLRKVITTLIFIVLCLNYRCTVLRELDMA